MHFMQVLLILEDLGLATAECDIPCCCETHGHCCARAEACLFRYVLYFVFIEDLVQLNQILIIKIILQFCSLRVKSQITVHIEADTLD